MGQDQQSLFIDEDGLFEDDRAVHQTLLCSRYARFHRLDTVVFHLQPSASRESVGNVQERESGHDSIENGGTSGAVRVSSGSSTGPEAGEVHHAALAHHSTLVELGAGLPSWIWMMPPVMAQIVETLILLRHEDFLLDFLDFLFLRLFFLENLVLLLMVLGIMLVLSFLVFLFLNLISKSVKKWFTCW